MLEHEVITLQGPIRLKTNLQLTLPKSCQFFLSCPMTAEQDQYLNMNLSQLFCFQVNPDLFFTQFVLIEKEKEDSKTLKRCCYIDPDRVECAVFILVPKPKTSLVECNVRITFCG